MFNFILKGLHMPEESSQHTTLYLTIDKQQQIIHAIVVALAHFPNEPKINRM